MATTEAMALHLISCDPAQGHVEDGAVESATPPTDTPTQPVAALALPTTEPGGGFSFDVPPPTLPPSGWSPMVEPIAQSLVPGLLPTSPIPSFPAAGYARSSEHAAATVLATLATSGQNLHPPRWQPAMMTSLKPTNLFHSSPRYVIAHALLLQRYAAVRRSWCHLRARDCSEFPNGVP